MSVFDKYSIDEISKRTKISPISLKYIKDKEYDKIPRVKFLGFIRLIEREFNTDLSEIVEEYDLLTNDKKEPPKKIKEKESKSFVLIFAAIILILGGILLYKNIKKTTKPTTMPPEINKTITQTPKIEETNTTQIAKTPLPQIKEPQQPLKTETNTSMQKVTQKRETNITIIPYKKLWFRVKNLDTNKTKDYIISNPKTLPSGNYYMKFGHGLFRIIYNDYNLTPDTKRIVRITIKDGNLTIKSRK